MPSGLLPPRVTTPVCTSPPTGLTLALQAPAADKDTRQTGLRTGLAQPEPATRKKARERLGLKVQFVAQSRLSRRVKPRPPPSSATSRVHSGLESGLPPITRSSIGASPGIDVVYSGDGGRLKTTSTSAGHRSAPDRTGLSGPPAR